MHTAQRSDALTQVMRVVVQGGVVAGLGSAGVMFGAVGAASDLMQDFRTGYLTLASPKVSCCNL